MPHVLQNIFPAISIYESDSKKIKREKVLPKLIESKVHQLLMDYLKQKEIIHFSLTSLTHYTLIHRHYINKQLSNLFPLACFKDVHQLIQAQTKTGLKNRVKILSESRTIVNSIVQSKSREVAMIFKYSCPFIFNELKTALRNLRSEKLLEQIQLIRDPYIVQLCHLFSKIKDHPIEKILKNFNRDHKPLAFGSENRLGILRHLFQEETVYVLFCLNSKELFPSIFSAIQNPTSLKLWTRWGLKEQDIQKCMQSYQMDIKDRFLSLCKDGFQLISQWIKDPVKKSYLELLSFPPTYDLIDTHNESNTLLQAKRIKQTLNHPSAQKIIFCFLNQKQQDQGAFFDAINSLIKMGFDFESKWNLLHHLPDLDSFSDSEKELSFKDFLIEELPFENYRMLVELNILDINAKGYSGRSKMDLFICKGNLQALRYCQLKQAKCEIYTEDFGSPFSHYILEGIDEGYFNHNTFIEMIKILQEMGVDFHQEGYLLPAQALCQYPKQCLPCLDHLLKNKIFDVNYQFPENAKTLLHIAVEETPCLELFKTLIDNGSSIYISDDEGFKVKDIFYAYYLDMPENNNVVSNEMLVIISKLVEEYDLKI